MTQVTATLLLARVSSRAKTGMQPWHFAPGSSGVGSVNRLRLSCCRTLTEHQRREHSVLLDERVKRILGTVKREESQSPSNVPAF